MYLLWCGRQDLNLHVHGTLPPQDSVSAVPPLPHILSLNVVPSLSFAFGLLSKW
jgi:hypothetical protein